MMISEHFTLEELTKSNTAKRLEIDNTPNVEQITNLKALVFTILEPIRKKYDKPIIVSSGFRCSELNKIVGGSTTSQHLSGQAVDIHSNTDCSKDNKELYDIIKSMVDNGDITVGQLINEYDYDWIHISLPNGKYKNEVLKKC